MKEYSFWYNETYINKGFIKAESIEQAKELLGKVQLGEIMFDELPGWSYKDKGYESDISTETLEELN